MRSDCPIGRSEGLEAQARVLVTAAQRSLIATLHLVEDGTLLGEHEVGLSNIAWRGLGASEGDPIDVTHAPVVESMSHVRAKIYGRRLNQAAIQSIIDDIAAARYSDLQVAAFLTACAGGRLGFEETVELTRSMIRVGQQLHWSSTPVMDKHCVGGLPGNRTTPIVVAIVSAAGLVIPKTSSRAITSPAGTADTMETLAPVELSSNDMRRVVEREGGCVVWGGAMGLSPVDDRLIRVGHPLELDGGGQLIASILSKKISAGATHIFIDLPVGPTAKVRTMSAAKALGGRIEKVGHAFGVSVRCLLGDGRQPVGHGIGPALEARDVLRVLQREKGAPSDLRLRSVAIAGAVLEMSGQIPAGSGEVRARALLDDGSAWRKFQSICAAQGGMRVPRVARLRHEVVAHTGGLVAEFDNRRLARVAKLAGAPKTPEAGVFLQVRLGDMVMPGTPLYTIHAQSRGELEYALSYVRTQCSIVRVASLDLPSTVRSRGT